MPEREINAAQVVRDIQSGLNDSQLMEKYKLSLQGLRHLYAELVEAGLLEEIDGKYSIPSLKINASEFVDDIRSGATGQGLMNKYRFTAAALQSALTQLIHFGLLSLAELSKELHLRHEAASPAEIRALQRYRLDFEVNVYDSKHPSILGMVRDITEKGIGIEGIETRVDEVMHLVVLGDPLEQVPPFEFQAICRWSKPGTEKDQWTAGFEITQISEDNRTKLRKLIELVVMEG